MTSDELLRRAARFNAYFELHFPEIKALDLARTDRFDPHYVPGRKALLGQCKFFLESEIPFYVREGDALSAAERLGLVQGVLVAAGVSIAEVDAIGLPTSLTA